MTFLFGKAVTRGHSTPVRKLIKVTDFCRSGRLLFSSRSPFDSAFDADEYEPRHRHLAKLVQSQSKSKESSQLLLIPAANQTFVADTVIPPIHYRQNADFTYLTGLTSSDAAGSVFALLVKDGQVQERHLFAPALLPRTAVWEGAAVRQLRYVEHLRSLQIELSDTTQLRRWIDQTKFELFVTKYWQSRPDLLTKYVAQQPVVALSPLLDQLRVIKSAGEMNAMRRTCHLAVEALNSTAEFGRKCVQNGSDQVHERQLAAHFEYKCRVNGSPRLSYPSVVAGAERAVTIHYGTNDRPIRSNQWVLMDAGCEDSDGYASDVTRCWPIDGQTNRSSLQFALYQALCSVQKELIDGIQVNRTTLNQLLHEQTRLLALVLKEFRIISASSKDQEVRESVYKFCPHHVSHYLGLDVHDSGSYSRDEPLRQGMCFTVEPGLYFRPEHDIPDEFKGIGLRVEDDILINQHDQIENLTQSCRYFS
jgi:Xaa-Pro aminopeptidase